jgi:DNA-binding CsgD family transcriptional regulator/tetratricopeptide (TPR) repeat protein
MDSERFVGRGAELARLRELLAGLADGVGGALLVVGEQGIGKSALLREAVTPAGGYWLGRGAADELGQHFPLLLMMDCLGAGGRLAVEAGGGEPDGGLLAGDPVPAAAQRLLDLVEKLCAASPVVIVAEDLQWADEASLLIWQQLSRAVTQLPLLVIGSCRPAPLRAGLEDLRGALAGRGDVLELGPLPAPEVGELAEELLSARPGQRLGGLLDRAAGNPLYLRELLDALVRDGRVRTAAGVAELAGEPDQVKVPASLAEAIGERLSALPKQVLSVLQWAAVLGPEFSAADLSQVSGPAAGELAAGLQQASSAGVVVEAGARLRFRHGLIHQALYESIPRALRDAMHLEAARALARAGVPADRVAAQLVPVSEIGDEWVRDWLAGAATTLTYQAPLVAAELLRRALAPLPEQDPRREPLEVALVRVAFLLVLDEEVDRIAGRILASTRDAVRAGEMAWLLAYNLARKGQRTEAAAEIVQAALARPGDGGVWPGRLRALHAMILCAMRQMDQAAAVAQAVVADAGVDPFAVGYARHALYLVAYRHQDHEAMIEHIDQALAAIGDTPQTLDLRLMLLANRSEVLGNLDRQAESAAVLRHTLELGERTGTPRLATIYVVAAQTFFVTGQWDDAVALLELAADLPSPDFHRIQVYGLLALIAAHRDDLETAQKYLAAMPDQQLKSTRFPASRYFLITARALLAERAGRPGEAAGVLADNRGLSGIADGFMLLPTLIRLALATGDEAAAAEAAQAADTQTKRDPLPVKAASASHSRGLVSGDPAPVLAAAAYYESSARVLARAQALEDAAVLLAGRGDVPAARRAYADATGLYRALDAGWDLRRADSRLRGHGIRPSQAGRQARPASGWAALTPTETTVARLVADGQPNAGIAAELSLSRNTVKMHISHILAKLGAHSRAEITRQALQHPAPARAAR